MKVLVLCTGNICRSPLAAAALQRALSRLGLPHEVESAGLGALSGRAAAPLAVETAGECGLDIAAHRARMVTFDQLESASLIVVMERWHRDEVAGILVAVPRRPEIRLLGDFLSPGERRFLRRRNRPREIPDPYGGRRRDYEAVRDLILEAAEGLALHLLAQW